MIDNAIEQVKGEFVWRTGIAKELYPECWLEREGRKRRIVFYRCAKCCLWNVQRENIAMAISRLRGDDTGCDENGSVCDETRVRSLRETHDVGCVTRNRGQTRIACRMLYLPMIGLTLPEG